MCVWKTRHNDAFKTEEMNDDYKALTYSRPLSLLTDFYEISMAYGYWKSKSDSKEAVFHLFFRI